MRGLSAWLGRITGAPLAWGLLILALFALWTGVLGPLIGWREAQLRDITRLSREAARMLEATRALEDDAAQLSARLADLDRERGLLQGGTVEQSAAMLQQLTARILAAQGARLASATVLPARPRGPFTEVSVRLAFETGHSDLAAILLGLESAEPYVIVRQIGIDRRVWNPDMAMPAVLHTLMEVTGLTRAAEAREGEEAQP